MIRVLLVDDSAVAITILKRMLSRSAGIEVVGTAGNGMEALNLIPRVKPDVICTDLHMPVMDGLEFTKQVMARHPLPILLVSVSGRESSLHAMNVIEAGAVDVFLKPGANDQERHAAELIMKIRILAGVHVFRTIRSDSAPGIGGPEIAAATQISLAKFPVRIIVIGASTGGPQALQTILTSLPFDFPLPVICIQHISDGFLQGLIDWLSSQCGMKVEMAQAGMAPRPGTIYFPQEDTHLKFDGTGRVVLSREPPYDGHRPSVTVTMKAIAEYYGNSACGVLLTGMGKDGAEGLLAIKKAGGMTIAQDEGSSIVFGMPKQAIELNAAGYVVPLNKIGPMILNFTLPLLERKH
jgi:two-component system chemotaxis response regulator CheB